MPLAGLPNPAVNKAEIDEKQAQGIQATESDTIKSLQGGMLGSDPATWSPAKPGVQVVPSQSQDESSTWEASQSMVPKTMELAPPETQTSRPINEEVFSAPEEAASVQTERASPTKDAGIMTGKNLALVVGIVALGFFLAM